VTGIVYVLLEVTIAGLDADTPQDVADQVDALLRPTFGQRLNTDVAVELIEYAGTPRPRA
jgi:hypothetical protein